MDHPAAPARRIRPPHVAVLVASLVLATLTTFLAEDGTEILIWIAAVYVYAAAGLLVLSALEVRATTRAAQEQNARRREPAEIVVARAVRDERRALALDIRAVLQQTLKEIHAGAGRLLTDPARHPGESIRLRERTHLATSELRRLLGILRVAEEDPAPPAPAQAHPEEPTLLRPPRSDVVQALVLAALALTEGWFNQRHRSGEPDPAVLTTTALVALLFVGRTMAPVITATAQSLVYALSFWAGAPVMSGVWMVRGVGAVLWGNAAAAPRVPALASALLLAATVVATRGQEPPLGVAASVAVVVVALVGGILVGRDRLVQRRLEESVAASRAADAEAVRVAVAAERVRVARELHDVISHSVGIIAVQLNVLDVAPDEEARRQAVRNIWVSSREAMRELDDVNAFPDSPGRHGPRTLADVSSLVDRVRATGVEVDLSVRGTPGPEEMSVVYRILQEAITNTMQHAPGARVQIRLAHGPDGTDVVVIDDGPGPTAAGPHRFGLVGLAERVALRGGTLESGPGGTQGGFRVTVHLPVQEQDRGGAGGHDGSARGWARQGAGRG